MPLAIFDVMATNVHPIESPVATWPTAFAYLDISDPLVAWLVYRGEMVSCTEAHPTAISSWTAGYLKRLADTGRGDEKWLDELALDALRADSFPHAVSRLKGFYAFPDPESAAAARRWNPAIFREDRLAEVAIRPGSRTSTHDAEWITHHLGQGGDRTWMHRYLAGEPRGAKPVWESLVDGRAFILGTELRENAYTTVRAAWPRSLAMLELARLGVECDVDVGLVTANVMADGDAVRVTYLLNFDANNPAYISGIDRLIASGAPINTGDLHKDAEWVVPDLMDRAFWLPGTMR